jgi:hypothetical protein
MVIIKQIDMKRKTFAKKTTKRCNRALRNLPLTKKKKKLKDAKDL